MQMAPQAELYKELQVAQQLSLRAGQMVLQLQNRIQLSYKPHAEPVTQVDVLVDKWICQQLAQAFPHDTIIAEESHAQVQPAAATKRIWFVDPIDGTAEYVKGGQNYTVMIGLAIEGIPRMGVIFQPASHVLWRAEFHAQPSRCRCERVEADGSVTTLDISQDEHNASGLIAVGFHARHLSFVKKLTQGMATDDCVLYKPSLGLKFALVAEGKADLCIGGMAEMKLWDTCAPAAVLLAAGGHVCSPYGAIFPYKSWAMHEGPACGIHPCYFEQFAATAQLC